MTAIAPADFGRVAVLMGGWSSERPVSLRSGAAVLQALVEAGVDAHGVDVDRRVDRVLRDGGYDRVFNVLHGAGGEDGTIQGLLEVLGLPYTGSGVTASAVSMDKMLSKRIWRAAGLPTPPFMRLTADTDWGRVVKALGLPLMVKPVAEGSSIGMTRVDDAAALPAAWRHAAESGGEVMAEAWIEGGEYTVAILDGEALPVICVETPRGFYDYEAKYRADDTRYLCPCGLPAEAEDEVQRLALAAFRTLGARGWGRMDLLRDGDGKFWLIELNTVPGMTDHSLVPKAAAAAGMDFQALVLRILATTLTEDSGHVG